MRLMRGALLSAGMIAGLAVAGAATAAPPTDSDGWNYSANECTGRNWSFFPTFTTQVDHQPTADSDNDVNAGETVEVALTMDRYLTTVTITESIATFEVGGVPVAVDVGPFTTSRTAPTIFGQYSFTVDAADEGAVVAVRSAAHEVVAPAGLANLCTTPENAGAVGLYVNRPPAPIDDAAETEVDTAVTVDVLANDNATWDSGTITSAVPTVAEREAQDDMAAIPPDARARAIAVSTPPDHGSAAVMPDGQIQYAPAAAFAGVDSFEYTVTDNDGASRTAMVAMTVTAEPPVVDPPDDGPDDDNSPDPAVPDERDGTASSTPGATVLPGVGGPSALWGLGAVAALACGAAAIIAGRRSTSRWAVRRPGAVDR